VLLVGCIVAEGKAVVEDKGTSVVAEGKAVVGGKGTSVVGDKKVFAAEAAEVGVDRKRAEGSTCPVDLAVEEWADLYYLDRKSFLA